MELFNEVRNKYFLNAIYLINKIAGGKNYTVKEARDSFRTCFKQNLVIVSFIDSLHLDGMNKAHEDNFGLFERPVKGNIQLRFQQSIPLRPTLEERSWLLNILLSPHSDVFLGDKLKKKLVQALQMKGIEDFKDIIDIRGCYSNADDVTDSLFAEKLRIIYDAIKNKKKILYSNSGAPNPKQRYESIPYRIEYSILEGKYRVSMFNEVEKRPIKANIDRMYDIKIGKGAFLADIELLNAIESRKVKEPVILLIDDKKHNQLIERCFALFSSHEHVGRIIEKDKYELSIFYYQFETYELVQKILMLGPDVKIVSDGMIKEKIIERFKQHLKLVN